MSLFVFPCRCTAAEESVRECWQEGITWGSWLGRGNERKGSEYSITPRCAWAERRGECLGWRDWSDNSTRGMRRNPGARQRGVSSCWRNWWANGRTRDRSNGWSGDTSTYMCRKAIGEVKVDPLQSFTALPKWNKWRSTLVKKNVEEWTMNEMTERHKWDQKLARLVWLWVGRGEVTVLDWKWRHTWRQG